MVYPRITLLSDTLNDGLYLLGYPLSGTFRHFYPNDYLFLPHFVTLDQFFTLGCHLSDTFVTSWP